MRALLICAAVAIPAVPAGAQSFASGPGVTVDSTFGSEWSSGERDRRRHHRRRGNVVVVGDAGWNDSWALYNNRNWESGSYNDWWHDRPDRAYPRWMQNNQDCERKWWGGGAWRC